MKVNVMLWEYESMYGSVLLDLRRKKSCCDVTGSWLTFGPPPCIFRARTVATSTTTLGRKPDARHLMLKNFSIPMSAPKPASVTERRHKGNTHINTRTEWCALYIQYLHLPINSQYTCSHLHTHCGKSCVVFVCRRSVYRKHKKNSWSFLQYM